MGFGMGMGGNCATGCCPPNTVCNGLCDSGTFMRFLRVTFADFAPGGECPNSTGDDAYLPANDEIVYRYSGGNAIGSLITCAFYCAVSVVNGDGDPSPGQNFCLIWFSHNPANTHPYSIRVLMGALDIGDWLTYYKEFDDPFDCDALDITLDHDDFVDRAGIFCESAAGTIRLQADDGPETCGSNPDFRCAELQLTDCASGDVCIMTVMLPFPWGPTSVIADGTGHCFTVGGLAGISCDDESCCTDLSGWSLIEDGCEADTCAGCLPCKDPIDHINVVLSGFTVGTGCPALSGSYPEIPRDSLTLCIGHRHFLKVPGDVGVCDIEDLNISWAIHNGDINPDSNLGTTWLEVILVTAPLALAKHYWVLLDAGTTDVDCCKAPAGGADYYTLTESNPGEDLDGHYGPAGVPPSTIQARTFCNAGLCD